MEAQANRGSWGKCLPTFEFVPAFMKKVSHSKHQEAYIKEHLGHTLSLLLKI